MYQIGEEGVFVHAKRDLAGTLLRAETTEMELKTHPSGSYQLPKLPVRWQLQLIVLLEDLLNQSLHIILSGQP